MIHFEWPWLFFALPLPLIVYYLLPRQELSGQAALKVPFLEDFSGVKSKPHLQNRRWPLFLALAGWVLLVIASARPQWLGEPIEQAMSGRDLMLAVDVSGSMEQKDFVLEGKRVNRLTATKKIASEFAQRRAGDRIGLILFGTTAYLQVPLTFDRKTVVTLLNEAFIGITDNDPATSIGDAIGLAVKRLKNSKMESRVLILLTDGANTAGVVTPLQAADLAAENNLKIYTIGIGADEVIIRSLFGNRKVNPSKDLDEETLIEIAKRTGGRYFRARSVEELEKVYELLDELEPVEKDKQYFRPLTELYPWPLAMALSLVTILVVTRLNWRWWL